MGQPGGWAFVVLEGDAVVAEGQGAAPCTSSLFMELRAAREGLQAAERLCGPDATVELCSDCSIVLEVVTGAFVPRPAAFAEPCGALQAVAQRLGARVRKVKAHAGDRWNEHVDARCLAVRQG